MAATLLAGGIAVTTWAGRAPSPESASKAGPSAPVVMPQGDLPGWQQVFADDFSDPVLGPEWKRYSGAPGRTSSRDVWHRSLAGVEDGRLVLRAQREDGRWWTGGVCACSRPQTYGKWEMRLRVDPNEELKYAALLWPTGDWPPEIDFAEDNGGQRSYTLGSLHHGRDNTVVQRKTSTDLRSWQVLGVEWTPGEVRFTIDGDVWDTIASDDVPDEPMWPGIQLQTGGCAADGSRCSGEERSPESAVLEVDWFTAYARQ